MEDFHWSITTGYCSTAVATTTLWPSPYRYQGDYGVEQLCQGNPQLGSDSQEHNPGQGQKQDGNRSLGESEGEVGVSGIGSGSEAL